MRLNTAIPLSFLLVLSLVISAAAFATDPPDSELNPVTGYTESVDLSSAQGNRVRHTVDMGQAGRTPTLISSAAGAGPRIAITSNGNSWVSWWKDAAIDEIHAAVRDNQSGSWTAEAIISETNESSRSPEIVASGDSAWIAYESSSGSSTSVAVVGITDDAEPIGSRTVLATTSFTGDVDITLRLESGAVWVTWVDDATYIGWSEWNESEEAWSEPDYESYASTSKEQARENIAAVVLGQ